MSDEVWKDIPDYEGMYQVSDLGRVKSLNRVDCAGKNQKGKDFGFGWAQKSDRYLKIPLSKNGLGKTFRVHTLVAISFIGPRLDGYVVDHIDNNPVNNSLVNLRYITHRKNISKDRVRKKDLPTGVYNYKDNRFYAQVMINNKKKTLGTFDSISLASKAYEESILRKSSRGSIG